MNTMALLIDGFQKVESFCTEHNVAKVQAGPNQICPKCAIELVETQNKNRQQEIDRLVREKHFAGAMLPERHAESGFKNYTVGHVGQEKSLKEAIAYARNILNGAVNNLVMVGTTGVGKTHLGCATARTLLNKGMYVRYITSEEMAQKIMRAWDKDTKDSSEQSVIYEFTQYDLLILDEYGLHDRDKRLELVHKVLYARYDAMKPTMLISNFTLKQLKDDLGDRLWSRFQQGGLTTIECNWADQRLGGGV